MTLEVLSADGKHGYFYLLICRCTENSDIGRREQRPESAGGAVAAKRLHALGENPASCSA